MRRGKKSKTETPSEPREKKKTTHFLCFPLATKTTVPLLAKSLEYFRSISTETETPEQRLDETADSKVRVVGEDATSTLNDRRLNGTGETLTNSNEKDPLSNTSKAIGEYSTFARSLQFLPSTAHRAAGTYHLTLGVMDLSEEAQMQKATYLLQSLDLQQILRDAEKGPPARTKQTSKCKDEAAKDTGEIEDEASAEDERKEDSILVVDLARGVKSLERPVSPPPASTNKARSNNDSILKEPSSLCVSLTGLGAFPKEEAARVIWARPREQSAVSDPLTTRPVFKDDNRLYNFGLHLREIFRLAGFITETRPLILHATVANMRYKTHTKAGLTTKGRKWAHEKKRWQEGKVNARPLLRLFKDFDGNVDAAEKTSGATTGMGSRDDVTDLENEGRKDEGPKVDARDQQKSDPDKEYIWLRDAAIDRVAICKMGATEAEDPVWGYWYPPISEKMIFDS